MIVRCSYFIEKRGRKTFFYNELVNYIVRHVTQTDRQIDRLTVCKNFEVIFNLTWKLWLVSGQRLRKISRFFDSFLKSYSYIDIIFLHCSFCAYYFLLPVTATFGCPLNLSVNILYRKKNSIKEVSWPLVCSLSGIAGIRGTFFCAGLIGR